MSARTYRGVVVDRNTQAGIAGLRVEAWDAKRVVGSVVGAADTDADGRFALSVTGDLLKHLFGRATPVLFFRKHRTVE